MTDRRFVRHLGVVVLVKLALIAGLWWAFVRDARIRIDAPLALAHIADHPAQRAAAGSPGVHP
ncbi:MAG: cytochrome oxidase putative small subunit CydP [Bradyrhizobium sp.]